MKSPCRKSWAGNLLMWSDLTLSPSFKVKRGQPNLKGFITHLLLILEVCNVKPTCRILWAGNLLMSDLNLAPCSRSNDGSLALVSCLSGGYRFASLMRRFSFVLFLKYGSHATLSKKLYILWKISDF